MPEAVTAPSVAICGIGDGKELLGMTRGCARVFATHSLLRKVAIRFVARANESVALAFAEEFVLNRRENELQLAHGHSTCWSRDRHIYRGNPCGPIGREKGYDLCFGPDAIGRSAAEALSEAVRMASALCIFGYGYQLEEHIFRCLMERRPVFMYGNPPSDLLKRMVIRGARGECSVTGFTTAEEFAAAMMGIGARLENLWRDMKDLKSLKPKQ